MLTLEGPGQYESAVLGIQVSVPNWIEAARAVMEWMRARPEVDAERIGVVGQSMGSFFGTLVAAAEPRFKACAVSATCLEPGMHTIFEEASPTFKRRFMKTLACPKRLVVYQDCRHSVGNVPSTNLGPMPAGLVADWMHARLAGKPFANERWLVESSGRVVKTPL